MFTYRAFILLVIAMAGAAPIAAALQSPGPSLELVTDEADIAMEILTQRRRGVAVDPALWGRLFASEGYRRLKARETAMGREFEDSAFRAFLLSDTLLARAPGLERTLAEWTRVRLDAPARRVLGYLPAGTRLRARVFLLVKPKTNSFVFEPDTDPAIMLYLDPTRSPAQLANTIAHELHHIGYAAACTGGDEASDSTVATARQWIGAFGEGVAMLAAAGGPEVHPHAESSPEDRERWDRDVANAAANLAAVERFLEDILDGRLTDPDSTRERGMSFFGVQGPWYTLGWLMATTIERSAGRPALVASLCDPPLLLRRYNEAAAISGRPDLPRWSDRLLTRLSEGPR